MTTYLFAGGGTAGHVNPLLATADALRVREPDAIIIVLGTREGLESRLVPERGYELVTIDRLPFPRRFSTSAVTFPTRLMRAVRQVRSLIIDRRVDVVVGFGGYAAAPAYLAAWRSRTPFVVHEANVLPGIANVWGAKGTRYVATTFAETVLHGAVRVGMPLRPEITGIDRDRNRSVALRHFALRADRPVLLVTGGSTGAARINAALVDSAQNIVDAGWQVIHTVGESRDFTDPHIPGYHPMPYCDRMDLALTAADFAVARSGAATVCELASIGLPSVLVPYPVGNGEQELNAQGLVAAGGAVLCRDADFDGEWIRSYLIPLLADEKKRSAMRKGAHSVGLPDGADRLVDLVLTAAGEDLA